MTITRADFRSDINGLRAWAVIAVILYHFGVPGFSGGFAGVDVFFVVSGFLMTGIVVKGLEQDRFSLVGFYMARARRIVPALFGLCVVLLVLGWFVLLPPDYETLSAHAISSLGFFSNFMFWNEAGYFDAASHEKWLLHTWSLSVEWQFYLLLPVLLSVVWRLKPGRETQARTVLAVLIVSVAASIFVTETSRTTAFFLLHTRAWEMLSGGLIFFYAGSHLLPPLQRRWLHAGGLLLILLSVAVFDSQSAWPGWRAVVPVIAAMLVIAANQSSPWTGNKVAQWLGDRSYSLYLWHWPVFVALVYTEFQHAPFAILGGMLLTLALAHLSYIWIEVPARRRLEQTSIPVGAALIATVVGVAVIPALWAKENEGVSGRFPSAIELVAAEAQNINPRNRECHSHTGKTSPSCVYGDPTWKVIAVGDSHLSATITGIAQAHTPGAGVVQWSYTGCQYVPGIRPTPEKLARQPTGWACRQFGEWAKSQLSTLPRDISVVILNRYAHAAMGFNEDDSVVARPDVYFSKIYPLATPEFMSEFSQHITQTACDLAKKRTVFLVRPIPEIGMDVPKTLSRRMAWGRTDDISISIEEYRKRNAWVWAAQDAARDQCGVRILDPTLYLCDVRRCYGSKNGRPLYSDDDHLSEFGNKLLTPMFAEVFQTR